MRIQYTDRATKVIAAEARAQIREDRNLYVDQAMAGLKARYVPWTVVAEAPYKKGAGKDTIVADDKATTIRLLVKENNSGVEVTTFVPKKGLTGDYFAKLFNSTESADWVGQEFQGKVIGYQASNVWKITATFDINTSKYKA